MSTRTTADRVGFFSSSILLGLLFVFSAFVIDGVWDGEPSARGASLLILLVASAILLAASFLCWAVLFCFSCHWRYHIAWMVIVSLCMVEIVILNFL